VHADANARQPIAIIFPHEANLRYALSTGDSAEKYSMTDLAGLCHDKSVHALLLRECNAAGKRSGFKSMELLQAVVLTPEEWTPQNGLVTAAQKLQRKKIGERYAAEIKVNAAVMALFLMRVLML
jgi:long-chain acyl-CoA synthetase